MDGPGPFDWTWYLAAWIDLKAMVDVFMPPAPPPPKPEKLYCVDCHMWHFPEPGALCRFIW